MRVAVGLNFIALGWVVLGVLPVAAQAQSTCHDYYGGEPNLTAEEATFLRPGGKISACRRDGKLIGLEVWPKPVLGDQNVCRYITNRIAIQGNGYAAATGNFGAAMAIAGECPRPDGPAYFDFGNAYNPTVALAAQTFALMQQGVGVPQQGTETLVRFTDLGFEASRIKAVRVPGDDRPDRPAPRFRMDVQIGLGSRTLEFETRDGAARFVGFR